jgi:uncharacterized protein
MTTLLQRARSGESLADVDIVDAHGHLGRPRFGVPVTTPASLVKVMDRIGVAASICSHIHCLYGGPTAGNDEVLGATRDFPGRILGYVRLWPESSESVRDEAARYLAEPGFVGLKLHNGTGHSYTLDAYEPALALANERRMLVLLHTWGRPDEMAEVAILAARYPEISFVLGHSGANRAEAEYIRLAGEHPNVYLDLCMSLATPGLVERLVAGAGIERVLWGSDAQFLSMTQQIGKVLGTRLTDDEKRAIFSANARRLLARIER